MRSKTTFYSIIVKKILDKKYFFYFNKPSRFNFVIKNYKNRALFLKYKKLAFLKKFNHLKWVYLMFMSFARDGKKFIVLKFYLKIIFFLKKKFFLKRNFLHYFFLQIFYNILPVLTYSTLTKKKTFVVYPKPIITGIKNQKKKLLALSIRWIRHSLILRKEKTIFLKLFSELNDIRMKRGNAIKAKKNFYSQFFITKSYERLRTFIWT